MGEVNGEEKGRPSEKRDGKRATPSGAKAMTDD